MGAHVEFILSGTLGENDTWKPWKPRAEKAGWSTFHAADHHGAQQVDAFPRGQLFCGGLEEVHCSGSPGRGRKELGMVYLASPMTMLNLPFQEKCL